MAKQKNNEPARLQYTFDLSKENHMICFSFMKRLKHKRMEFISDLITKFLELNDIGIAEIEQLDNNDMKYLYSRISELSKDETKNEITKLLEMQKISCTQIEMLSNMMMTNIRNTKQESVANEEIQKSSSSDKAIQTKRNTRKNKEEKKVSKEDTYKNNPTSIETNNGSPRTTNNTTQEDDGEEVMATYIPEDDNIEDNLAEMLGNNFDFG